MTPLTEDQWRRLYVLFDPKNRVEDPELFVERPAAAYRAIVDDVLHRLEPSGTWVLCGSMGSGKSSELVHLAAELHKSRAVVALDLPQSVIQVERLQPVEILLLIGAAAVRTAQENFGRTIDPARLRAFNEAYASLMPLGHAVNLSDLLQGVALFAANVLAPGSTAVAGAATGAARALGAVSSSTRRTPLGGSTRIAGEDEAGVVRLKDAITGILREVEEHCLPPVVLVDGLDKVQQLDAIRGLFTSSRLLAQVSAPVVYTGPITLMLNSEWQTAGAFFRRQRLTNLVTRRPTLSWIEVSDDKISEGLGVLRQIVAARVRSVGLELDHVVDPDVLGRLLRASGGLVRDLIHLTQRACRAALTRRRGRVDDDAATQAIQELRKEYEITLTTRRVEELVHVAEHGEPRGGPVSDELLLGGYVLPYANGRVWFEPHPILAGLRPGL